MRRRTIWRKPAILLALATFCFFTAFWWFMEQYYLSAASSFAVGWMFTSSGLLARAARPKQVEPAFHYPGGKYRKGRRLTGSAEVIGIEPSKDFVPPIMNLDGPPRPPGVEPRHSAARRAALGWVEPPCRHPEPVNVHLSDGRLVAWICEECGTDGRYPW